MRGKPLSDYDGSGTNRITPADAGKTVCRASASIINRDHPLREDHNGITPADAGKTCYAHAVRPPSWDHPRGCGENLQIVAQAALMPGSPPRMRGKHRLATAGLQSTRITPADAGKTTRAATAWRKPRDHPRGCGENAHSPKSEQRAPGSPPRMRGKLNNLLIKC